MRASAYVKTERRNVRTGGRGNQATRNLASTIACLHRGAFRQRYSRTCPPCFAIPSRRQWFCEVCCHRCGLPVMQVPRLLRLSFLLRLVAADAAPLVDVSAAAATAPAELMDAIAARDAAREALEIHSCVCAFVRSCVRAFVHWCIRSFSIAGLCYGPRGRALLHSKTIAESLSAAGAKNNCATGHSLHSVTTHASTCATFSLCQN